MKTALSLLCSALVLCALRAEDAPPAPPPAPAAAPASAPAPASPFSLVGADYKKPQELPDNFFNPFKVDATFESALQKKNGPVTNEAITDALDLHGVSGIVYASAAGQSRVLIGDQVFSVGEEVTFPDLEKGGTLPLVPGANVTLREVSSGQLFFDVVPEGETGRRFGYSLRQFWKP
jgi:hypothetical protein